ncbi:BZ3500_MvSof-1268-A1-R1_Chr1-1g00867 [Microbotryum saponariae]|uniref:Structure-specific endonuclease subunit SLX4 n=1 Tax=Microbotryum saponariae TaxID=289078 RepID=A0A2X0KE10_9BASI|nr:BZ3500_MvSof-1268-A1-R1_Chr1-1g00867 [Microbotryum saponariae]SCZ92812.1 BZ3501_MvSof-1269-A2-R1_Chr1-1g00464 [Microbotryum saponariae]
MRPRSESPAELVEDSEPERARPGFASDEEDAPITLRSVQLDLTASATSAEPKEPVPSTSTSVPKVLGRWIPPWERQRAAPLASTSSHVRKLSIESNSSSASSSMKRPYSTSINRADVSISSSKTDKKKVKIHQSAADLLSESASGSDHSPQKAKEMILKPTKRVPNKLKNKGKERMIAPPSPVPSSPSSALDVMMDSSIEVYDLRSDTSESDRKSDSDGDLDPPVGSRLQLNRFKYEKPTEDDTLALKRRKKKVLLLPSAEPVVLPSRARVRLLDRCPLCDLYFSTSRSAEWKEGHLRACALTKDYTSETVRVRVEQQILDLAAEAESRRLDPSRTLFDRMVGKGEGANAHIRVVTVVGVEVGDGAEWTREGKEIGKMQTELEKGMRKPTRDKVIREAAEIRREGWERERRRGEEEAKKEWGQAQTPRATGVLKPESASSRQVFAGRIEGALGALGGSGLTQAPSKRRESQSDEEGDVFLVDDSLDADQMMEPPSTQLFAPSALVENCAETNEIQAVAIPSKLVPKTKRRARSKASKCSDFNSDTDEERFTRSLWSAAAGHDDEIIQEVVLPPPTRTRLSTHTVSPPSSPSSLLLLSTPEHDRLTPHRRRVEVQVDTPSTMDGSPTRGLRSSMTALGLGGDDDVAAASGSGGPDRPSRRSVTDEMVIDDDDDAKSDSASDLGEGAWEDEIYNDGVMMWDGREEIGTLAVSDDGSSSSEEEPLAAVAKRSATKSTGRKVGRPRKASTPTSISSPSPASSDPDEVTVYDSVNPPPGCPDYSSQPLETLRRQVKGFGFRVSKEKSVLVDQLVKVWVAMHPAEPPTKSPRVKKPKAAAAKKTKKKKDEAADASEEEVVDERSLNAKLRESVLANEAIYLKVLRYEPIFFDDIVALATGSKIKVAKAVLAKWLDDQCITFYTQDPTNGSRRRYK